MDSSGRKEKRWRDGIVISERYPQAYKSNFEVQKDTGARSAAPAASQEQYSQESPMVRLSSWSGVRACLSASCVRLSARVWSCLLHLGWEGGGSQLFPGPKIFSVEEFSAL